MCTEAEWQAEKIGSHKLKGMYESCIMEDK